MPGTFWNRDYEVAAIYGMFELAASLIANDSVITYLVINTTPDYWIYSSVSSSWSPTDLISVDSELAAAGLEVASVILPLDIPITVSMHSANKTKVWIKKIAIISDDVEIDAKYPDAVGDYAYSPNQPVNWNNCRIKYYLKVDPDDGVVNPAAGCGRDRVLIEWDPKAKKFTKIGSYVVVGWDENLKNRPFKFTHRIFVICSPSVDYRGNGAQSSPKKYPGNIIHPYSFPGQAVLFCNRSTILLQFGFIR